jgi:hypothetical protein
LYQYGSRGFSSSKVLGMGVVELMSHSGSGS